MMKFIILILTGSPDEGAEDQLILIKWDGQYAYARQIEPQLDAEAIQIHFEGTISSPEWSVYAYLVDLYPLCSLGGNTDTATMILSSCSIAPEQYLTLLGNVAFNAAEYFKKVLAC